MTSDAEFSVFIGPIDQVGCAPACSGVTSSSRSADQPRNGPPEAVSTILATSSAVPPRRHCASAECSESTGTIWPGCGGLEHQRPAGDQRFLVGQRQPGAGGQRRQRRLQAQRADQRVEHDVGLGVLDQPGDGVGARVGDVAELGGGGGVGDRDIGHAGLGALPGQQVGISAARGQPDDLEAVGVGGDDLQRLGADRPGAAEDQHAQPVAHRPIVPPTPTR